jgi:hypothetical protein
MSSFEVCEIIPSVGCNPESGLYSKIEKINISQPKNQRINVEVLAEVANINKKFVFKLKKLTTSLSKQTKLIIAPFNLVMPPPVLTINGTQVKIDPTNIKNAIYAERSEIAKLIVEYFASYFSTNALKDMNQLLEQYLNNLSSEQELFNHYSRTFEKEVVNLADYRYTDFHVQPAARDKTYVAPTFRQLDVFQAKYKIDMTPKVSPMEAMLEEIRYLVWGISYNVSLKEFRAPAKRDLFLSFNSNLSLNGKNIGSPTTSLHNGKGKLTSLDVYALHYSKREGFIEQKYDVGIGVSEPLVNKLLGETVKKGIVNHFLQKEGKSEVKVTGLNVHFEATSKPYLSVVANLVIDMKKMQSNGVGSWLENRIGSWLEGGYIYFPLEIRITPFLMHKNGKYFIRLVPHYIVENGKIRNTYGYPMKDMYGSVERGVISSLTQDIWPSIEKIDDIDLTPYLDMGGVKIVPKDLFIRKSGHLFLTGRIKDIDFNFKNN